MGTLLFILASVLAVNPVRAQAKVYAEAGHPDVGFAYRNAGADYRDAIPLALADVDPEGLHPEWEYELWRICKREAWCGRWGPTKVHAIDGWTGSGAYLWAAWNGKLDPTTCVEHRLADYTPVLRALRKWERKRGKKRPDVRATIEAYPVGVYEARDFATRGGFGQNAARNLHHLGQCVAPTALDNPYDAARVALHTFDGCKVWDDDPERPGYRSKRHCTCVEHTARWVGVGQWKTRPLLAFFRGKSRHKSVRSQCGKVEAATYVFDSMLSFVFSLLPTSESA